ncbi:MAG: DUF4350 domain-containing protein [Enhygromyxa sp.]
MSGALAAAWLSAALLGGPPPTAEQVGDQVERILGQERYLFCAEGNDYSPRDVDRRWCSLAAAAAKRCPGYVEVCERGREGAEVDLSKLSGGDGSSEQDDQTPGKANAGAYEEREPWELPDLGGFARVLMWLLLIGGAAAIVWLIVKNLVRGRDDDEPELELEADAGDSLLAARAAAMRVVETDVQRLLARAEQAAAKGDHEAGINDVYAALLRRLEGEQLIAVEHWKTNGDYLGELRSRPPLRDEVREIVREVEQVQFGAAAAEQGRYFNIRTKVLAVVGRAALALALTLGLGCPLFDDPDALPNSAALAGLGSGPWGKRAVGELLLLNEIEARHRTHSIEQLTAVDGAIVLLDDVELVDEDWDTLLTWVEEDGGTLIIATGKDFPTRIGVYYHLFDSGTVLLPESDSDYRLASLEPLAPAGRVLTLGAEAAANRALLRREAEVRIDAQGFAYDANPQAYAVQRRLGAGAIVVFAEPDMLTNVGISVADNAAFLINLLHQLGVEEVEFVDRYTGAGPDNPFESVGNAKLGGLFLQILLFLALLYAAVGIPFARLRDPQRQRRRSFVEHVATLGQRYAQARASRYVAGLYSAWALDRLRERTLLGAGGGLLPLAQAIAARTGRDEASVMQLLVNAHDLRDYQQSTRGSAADLELMRQLARLLDEVGGGR